MDDPPWNVVTNFCANCQFYFENDSLKATKLDIVDNDNPGDENSVTDINIPILDALLYVYGLSYQDFAQVFSENIDTTTQYFGDEGRQELALCCNCLEVFKDVYYINVKFENLSRKDALLRKVIKLKSNGGLSVKNELVFTESDDCRDDYLDSLNADLEDDASDANLRLEIKKECVELNNYHLNPECLKPAPNVLIEVLKQSGKPKTVSAKSIKVRKVSKTNSQPKTAITKSDKLTSENDCSLQPFVRLTRSKVNVSGTKLTKDTNAISSDEEVEYNSSSGSDFEGESGKKRKQPLKRKKGSCVSKRSKVEETQTIESDGVEITENHSESLNVTTENATEAQNKVNQDYVKIRPENGKRLVYICNLCGKSVTRLKKFKVHMNSHKKAENKEKRMKRRKVKCPNCDKVCMNEDSLKIHISKRHSEEPKVCDKCGKTFQRIESFRLHQQFSHNEEKPFECKTCGLKYKWKASLLSHELTHKNPRPHVCEKCGISYTNKSNLNQHKTYHEDEERDKELFRCKECNKLLKNRKSLQKHINRTHREDKQECYTCPTCGISMKRKENLTAHMKIHDPNRMFNRIITAKPKRRPNINNDGGSLMQPRPPWGHYQL